MILIQEDESYLSNLDLAAIDKGIAEMAVYSLRITNYFTEEQKQNNSATFDTVTPEQWKENCEKNKQAIAGKIKFVVDQINQKYMIYQYINKNVDYSKDDWDLFFWCNNGDMSYVTLNTNTEQTLEKQNEMIGEVLDLIRTIEIEGLQVTIQYTAIYDKNKVEEIVCNYCEEVKGSFIEYGGRIGKINVLNDRYVFRKKGAKKYCYEINNNTVLGNVLLKN
jgi:hypothetical protein